MYGCPCEPRYTGAFARFPTLEAFCAGSEEEIAELIRSCGLYKTKARDIFAMCHVLRDSYNGVIPDTVDELTKLPGVGRKTANLVVGDIYKKPAVVTDTHCIRITGRLGLTESNVPLKVEKDLRAVLPPKATTFVTVPFYTAERSVQRVIRNVLCAA